ncbi:MAG: DUF3667 domain-containing protein [Sphingomonas sp.]|uniref:DUF3667 domain-containing protein n=1 Tax=Sphingomonas sp. TaxID=28214 RepID=UPI001B1764E1|nr:DUF3667 domain-containing protein [Sphingomonas sp.]MBO9622119.1 DUF3667 domain-containing protein [Sphingomonas sp.]
MGEIDAAGEMITGALLGRAVESAAGEGHGHGGACLNCRTELVGPHCHRCGQAGHVHRSLAAVAHEILHGVFHFEGKLWRTLPMLAWRPGDLTRRFIAGERARFVSPMAIFLFSIFAMFAVFSFAGISPPADMRGVNDYPMAAIKLEREKVVGDREKALEQSRDPGSDAGDRAETAKDIADADARLKDLDAAAAQLKDSASQGVTKHTGWHALDHLIEKWQNNPSLMIYKFQSSAYKFSWLLIPLSLPFVWLLFFWKRQYKLYDHTVFITYSIAFMSLLFIVLTLAGKIGVPASFIGTAATLVPFVHVTRQLKQAYALRWWSAVARALVLSFFIFFILAIFAVILFLLGAG